MSAFPCSKVSIKPAILKDYGLHPYGWGVRGYCQKCARSCTFTSEETGQTEFKVRPCMEKSLLKEESDELRRK